MSRKQVFTLTIVMVGIFIVGMASGFLISLVDEEGPVKVRGDYVEIQTSYGSISRLSKKVVDELGRMNGELREGEEVSEGLWRIMFTTSTDSSIRVRSHPSILKIALMLKEYDGKIDYGMYLKSNVNCDK